MENSTHKLLAFSFVLLSMFLGSCSNTAKQAEVKAPEIPGTMSSSEQLEEIMKIWPGKYNNYEQISQLEKEGQDIWRLDDSGEGGYLQIESHYIELDLPEIGDHVLYVEEYRDHDPEETYRQRIYTLSLDDSLDIVRVKMWPFKDKKKYVGAWQEPGILTKLNPEEISAYPDKCDLLVEQKEGAFYMYMNGKDCAFGDNVFNYEVMLSEGLFRYRDKISSLSGDSLLTSAANFAYHDLKRITK